MVSLIIGNKGSGKTKRLINLVNEAIERSNGNVVCVEKERLSGIVAGDHDITDVLVDATLKIGGRDYQALAAFLKKVSELSKISDQDFTFTISADESELPKEIFEYCEKI